MSWSFVRKIPLQLIKLFTDSFEISNRGVIGLGVFVQDQTTEMLDLLFLQTKFAGLTLASDTVIDLRVITLSPGHGLTDANSKGHVLEIADIVNNRFMQAEIQSIVANVVTLDQPVSCVFVVANTVIQTGNSNLTEDTATGIAIDGSVTPVIFKVKPLPTQKGDITRVMAAFTSSNTMDLTTFGGALALTNGVTLRVKRPDGSFKNLYNYKAIFDFAMHGFDTRDYSAKVTGNTIQGFGGRITFSGKAKHGVVARLDGTLGEEIQIVITELMDNTASGNITTRFIAEGHELQE